MRIGTIKDAHPHLLNSVVVSESTSFIKGDKMTYFIWLLRIIHIVGGIFWVGGTLTMAFFIAPTVGATA